MAKDIYTVMDYILVFSSARHLHFTLSLATVK